MWPVREATVWKARWQLLKRLDALVIFDMRTGEHFQWGRAKNGTGGFASWKRCFCSSLDRLCQEFDKSTGSAGGRNLLLLMLLVEVSLGYGDRQMVRPVTFQCFFFFFLSCLPFSKLFCGDAFPDGSVSKTIWLDRFVLSRWTFEMNNIWE